MRKRRGFAAVIPLLLFVVGLVVALILVGKQTVFNNRAASKKTASQSGLSPWGNAISLDGNSYIKVASSSGINPKLGFTVEAWVKPTPPPLTTWTWYERTIIAKLDNSVTSYRLWMSINSHPDTNDYLVYYLFELRDGSTSCTTQGSRSTNKTLNATQLGSWQHLAGVVQSDGTIDLFLNGVREPTFPSTIKMGCPTTTPLTIGGHYLNNTLYSSFQGQIDEVRISNTAKYTANFSVPSAPNTADYTNDFVLYHFDSTPQCNVLTKECFTSNYTYGKYDGQLLGNVSFVPSTISPQCQRNNPLVTVSPMAQTGTPGQQLSYKESITNTDSSGCPNAPFNTNITVLGTTGWLVGMPANLTLSPGQTATPSFQVVSPKTATPNIYVMTVNVTNQSSSLSAISHPTYIIPNPTHKECQNYACTVVSGAGSDACYSNTDCAPPPPPQACLPTGSVCKTASQCCSYVCLTGRCLYTGPAD